MPYLEFLLPRNLNKRHLQGLLKIHKFNFVQQASIGNNLTQQTLWLHQFT